METYKFRIVTFSGYNEVSIVASCYLAALRNILEDYDLPIDEERILNIVYLP